MVEHFDIGSDSMPTANEKPADALKNRREWVLKKANEIVNGEREGQYGKPENNFQVIADLWNSYLEAMTGRKSELMPSDIANMIVVLKIGRCTSGQYKEDNYIDICGYAAIAAELEENGL